MRDSGSTRPPSAIVPAVDGCAAARRWTGFRTLATVGIVGLALSGVAASAALAQEGRGTYVTDRPVFALAAPRGWPGQRTQAMDSAAGHRHVHNPAFAGYSTGIAGAADLVARFRVPGVACSKKEAAIGPGAFLLAGPHDRVLFDAANVIFGCFRGVATAQEAMVVNGDEVDYVRQVEPGDVMIAHLTDAPDGQTIVQLRDLHPGRRWLITRTGRGATPDAELVGDWGSVDGQTGAQVPPPDFEATTFHAISVDGHALGSTSPTSYDMASSHNVLQISTGPLGGAARDMFTIRRRLAPG